MNEEHEYLVIAFYKYVEIGAPHEEVAKHKKYLESKDVASRIYISEEGINGQMSARKEDGIAYMEWMHSQEPFADLHFKLHTWHEQVFPKQTVKYRRQLVALDKKVDTKNGGQHLSPAQWRERLESGEDYLLLDVRNDYETKVGYFEGAEMPPCNTFREFNTYADNLKEEVDTGKPIMMYCTGGIRCEVYSALLKEKGFENVFQLNGGIINYGLEEGAKKWLGKLFVFDDRMTVPISEKGESPVVGACHFCGCSTDNYYNCANMDCNHLFLSCLECLEQHNGCCKVSCAEAPRVRPYSQQNPHKPFRKYHAYFGEKKKTMERGACGKECSSQ